MSSFICTHCHTSFDNKTERDYHTTKCIPSAEVDFAGTQVTVFNKGAGFECHCSYKTCKKTYGSVKSLKGHIKNAIGKGATWTGANEVSFIVWTELL